MKLLTLNTHSWREEESYKKITHLAEAIIERDYDVIALQEVNQMTDKPLMADGYLRQNNFMLVLLEEIKKRQGPSYHSYWRSSKTLRGYYEEGSCILSKFPILEERVFTVSKYSEHTSPKKRNIVQITIDLEGQLIDIYSCHLGWWHDEIEPFKGQWETLCNHLRTERLSLLLGDFNNNANLRGEGYDELIKHGLWDTYTLAERKDKGITVQGEIAGWKGNQLDLRIDLILATQKLKVKSSKVIFNGVYKEVVSDHYGVEVELDLGMNEAIN